MSASWERRGRGREIRANDLVPLYELLEQESLHWGVFGKESEENED